MSLWPKVETKELPLPPHWSKAVGVGIIVMGMAMGTGELIMWPHLVVKHGLGILWLALVGITLQYFINQEVARTTIATGDSFFSLSARLIFWSPIFWLLAAILLYIWPAWASILGTLLASLFGFGTYIVWSWLSLALVLAITLKGQAAYHVLEKTLKIIVPVFIFLLVLVSAHNFSPEVWLKAGRGLINFGYIPKGIDLSVLLGAIVFSGAGGMLNLCVSLWYRDKGVGLGHYVGRITNPITGKSEATAVGEFRFEPTKENISRWQQWLNYVRIDQGLVFWLTGLVSMILLSINAFTILEPRGLIPEGIHIATTQASIFSSEWGILGEKLYLLMAYLMLFSVMWTVLDALTRIVSDIVHTNSRAGRLKKYFNWLSNLSLHHLYYFLFFTFVFCQALLLPFKQPFSFLVISSVLGGLSMAIYVPILIYLNNFKLESHLRPSWFTNLVMISAAIFYWYFSLIIILDYLK